MKVLNFGCGDVIHQWCVNADIQKGKEVDYSFDFNKKPYPFKDNTFSLVIAENILEHLDDLNLVVNELWRICKHEASIFIDVPYYNSYNSFSDPTHKHYLHEESLRILFEGAEYDLKGKKRFEIDDIELTPIPFFKFVPMRILKPLSHFIPNLISNVKMTVSVIKQ